MSLPTKIFAKIILKDNLKFKDKNESNFLILLPTTDILPCGVQTLCAEWQECGHCLLKRSMLILVVTLWDFFFPYFYLLLILIKNNNLCSWWNISTIRKETKGGLPWIVSPVSFSSLKRNNCSILVSTFLGVCAHPPICVHTNTFRALFLSNILFCLYFFFRLTSQTSFHVI